MAPPDTNIDEEPEGRHVSIWLDTTPEISYDALEGGFTADTVVVGGGIAGISTAYELAEAGQTVAVLERDHILNGVTGHTTAKLTSLHGLIYDHLVDHFGLENARLYAEANQASIETVEERATQYSIDCEFERAPAYTYTESREHGDRIRAEVAAAQRLGLPATYTESTSLPFDIECAVRFDRQAHFHPRAYLLALAQRITDVDGYIFERTTARNLTDGTPCHVSTNRGTVTADNVVIATHFPFYDRAFYFTRLSPKRSYVVAARLREQPPTGMYYRQEEPYFSVRPHPAEDTSMVLIGGQNHRTGHGGSTVDRYRALERQARDRFDIESIEYRWATQDYVSADRVPFIGTHSPQVRHIYIATGFGGWGMTNGIAAGRILADHILDRENPWETVFRPTRFTVGASTHRLLSHNAHAMKHLVEGFFRKQPTYAVESIDRGTGAVVESENGPVGVHRDDDGHVHIVSATCTHMNCVLEWNDGERTWDCPCHGSRFDVDGSVLDTPAIDELKTYDLDELDSIGRR